LHLSVSETHLSWKDLNAGNHKGVKEDMKLFVEGLGEWVQITSVAENIRGHHPRGFR
jgi:hypothetical protein